MDSDDLKITPAPNDDDNANQGAGGENANPQPEQEQPNETFDLNKQQQPPAPAAPSANFGDKFLEPEAKPASEAEQPQSSEPTVEAEPTPDTGPEPEPTPAEKPEEASPEPTAEPAPEPEPETESTPESTPAAGPTPEPTPEAEPAPEPEGALSLETPPTPDSPLTEEPLAAEVSTTETETLEQSDKPWSKLLMAGVALLVVIIIGIAAYFFFFQAPEQPVVTEPPVEVEEPELHETAEAPSLCAEDSYSSSSPSICQSIDTQDCALLTTLSEDPEAYFLDPATVSKLSDWQQQACTDCTELAETLATLQGRLQSLQEAEISGTQAELLEEQIDKLEDQMTDQDCDLELEELEAEPSATTIDSTAACEDLLERQATLEASISAGTTPEVADELESLKQQIQDQGCDTTTLLTQEESLCLELVDQASSLLEQGELIASYNQQLARISASCQQTYDSCEQKLAEATVAQSYYQSAQLSADRTFFEAEFVLKRDGYYNDPSCQPAPQARCEQLLSQENPEQDTLGLSVTSLTSESLDATIAAALERSDLLSSEEYLATYCQDADATEPDDSTESLIAIPQLDAGIEPPASEEIALETLLDPTAEDTPSLDSTAEPETEPEILELQTEPLIPDGLHAAAPEEPAVTEEPSAPTELPVVEELTAPQEPTLPPTQDPLEDLLIAQELDLDQEELQLQELPQTQELTSITETPFITETGPQQTLLWLTIIAFSQLYFFRRPLYRYVSAVVKSK